MFQKHYVDSKNKNTINVTLLFQRTESRLTNHLYLQNYKNRPTSLRVLWNGGRYFQNWVGAQASVAKPTKINTCYEEMCYKTGLCEVQRYSGLKVTLMGTAIKRK
jgi:hypothetical protein